MFNQHYSIKIKCNECNKKINHGNIVSKNNKIMHYLCYKRLFKNEIKKTSSYN